MRCKNADDCVLLELRIMAIRLDMGFLIHVIASQIGLIDLSIARVIIQFPIDHRLR